MCSGMAWAASSILSWIMISDVAAQADQQNIVPTFSNVSEIAKNPCAANDAVMVRKEDQPARERHFWVLPARAIKTLGLEKHAFAPARIKELASSMGKDPAACSTRLGALVEAGDDMDFEGPSTRFAKRDRSAERRVIGVTSSRDTDARPAPVDRRYDGVAAF